MMETSIATPSAVAVETTTPRVCFLLDSFYPVIGGGENHARLLARQLTLLGSSLFVLTRRSLAGSPVYEQLDGYPVYRVWPIGLPRLGKYLMMIPAFWFLARRHRDYEVIYVCGMRSMGVIGVLCAWLFKKTCVLRSESRDELRGDHIARHSRVSTIPVLGWLPRMWLWVRNQILLQADRFLAISPAIEEEYQEVGVPETKLVAIPNGIDTDEFAPCTPEEKRAIRERLQLPDKTLVMYTGKLNKGKGLELLLQVWATISQEFPEAHLVLVGSGAHQFLSCEQALRGFVRERSLQDGVTFTGSTHQVAAYLKGADVFVLPSESEALPISLLEAMAAGLPVVATAVGGIPGIVVDRQNGHLIEARDAAALAQRFREVLTHPAHAEELGQQGRATVVERFQIEAVAIQHQDLFREISPSS